MCKTATPKLQNTVRRNKVSPPKWTDIIVECYDINSPILFT